MENQNTLAVDEALELAECKKYFELRKLLLEAEPADIAQLFEKFTPNSRLLFSESFQKSLRQKCL